MDTEHLRSVLKVGEIKTRDGLSTEQSTYACMGMCVCVCTRVHARKYVHV